MYICLQVVGAEGTSVLMSQDSISIFELAETHLLPYVVPRTARCISGAGAMNSCLQLPIMLLMTAVCRKLQQSGKVTPNNFTHPAMLSYSRVELLAHNPLCLSRLSHPNTV